MSLQIALISVVLWGSPAGGTSLYVDDDAPPGGDGLSWETAYRFLQDALVDLPDVTDVLVAGGGYRPDRSGADPDGSGDRFATFQLISGVRYSGGYAGLEGDDPDDRDPDRFRSILSGDLLGDDGPDFENNGENSHHVVTASGTDASTQFDGFTITAGHANGPHGPNLDGAGILNLGGSPLISNCTFVGNVAATDEYPLTGSNGGGIYNCSGSPRIVDCLFDDNVGGAGGGGGIYTCHGNPIIIDCVFTRNYAGTNAGGPAISNFKGSPVVIGSVFRENSSFPGAAGGAVRHQSAESMPIFLGCLFEGNHSGGAGGAYRGGSNGIVEHCTFIDNTSELSGGAMRISSGVRDCVFVGNRSGRGGGAISSSGPGTIANCWFEDNVAEEEGGAVYVSSLNGNLSAVNCVFIGNRALKGGGIYAVTLPGGRFSNCTLIDNVATEAGGAYGGPYGAVVNSIMRGNVPDQIHDEFDVLVAFCNVEGGWPGQGNIDADPLFVYPDGLDFRLTADSPCVDAGWNLAVPLDGLDLDFDHDTAEYTPQDFDGRPRFVDAEADDVGCGTPALVDIGAFEYPVGLPRQPRYGDLDGDGVIGFADLLIVLEEFGAENGCRADLDVDGEVGYEDLVVVLSLWD